jgi:four helix bundle protein
LPKTAQAKHIGRQILRSGTAAAANYGEARGAESRSDFVHKLRLVLKELNETGIWLDLIVASSLLPAHKSAGVVAENAELCRIIAASIRTAGGFDRS